MKQPNTVGVMHADATLGGTAAKGDTSRPRMVDVDVATDEKLPDTEAAPVGVTPLYVHALIVSKVFEGALGPDLVRRIATPGNGIGICLSVPGASRETPLSKAGRPWPQLTQPGATLVDAAAQ